MGIDEARKIAESTSATWDQLNQAVGVLAAAVRDDDLVPCGHEVIESDWIDRHERRYCLRSDLPKPTRKVVLREWVHHDDSNVVTFHWFKEGSKPIGRGYYKTGNTREIEVPEN